LHAAMMLLLLMPPLSFVTGTLSDYAAITLMPC